MYDSFDESHEVLFIIFSLLTCELSTEILLKLKTIMCSEQLSEHEVPSTWSELLEIDLMCLCLFV